MILFFKAILTKIISIHTTIFLLMVCLIYLFVSSPIYAESPTIIIGFTDTQGCIVGVSQPFDLDTFTRDSLPQEVGPRQPSEALKANAILIRNFIYHFYLNPEWDDPSICNPQSRFFHMRHSRIQGWIQGDGATRGNDNTLSLNGMTNNRVTDVGGKTLNQHNIGFNACIQNESINLVNQGYNYDQILTDPTIGLYRIARCGFPQYPDLSLFNPYSFTNSMTNGTNSFSLNGGTHTNDVTPVWTVREAERYWGHSHIDAVLNNPFSESGTYLLGWNRGDKVEYRMDFGGTYENLHLIGISDMPGPIEMNIYIDGYFQDTMQWIENDNSRHLRVDKITGIPYGSHAIAIEFKNDYCECLPWSNNVDRNFYIDMLGVNDGPITSETAMFYNSIH